MKKRREFSDDAIFGGAILFVIVLGTAAFIGLSIFTSVQEARAYNRVTGSQVTWWDAMWVELRVDGTPSSQ